MKAIEIFQTKGPAEGLRLADLPDPELNPHTGRPGVVIEVRAAGVAFPEVLQSWGKYQVQPEVPFVPGSEVAGTVRSAPEGSRLEPGQKVMAFCILGGFAGVAIAPDYMTFPLPDSFDYAEGAGFLVNYHTAWFGMVKRGRLVAGEWVLVHGAAGGLGLATVQVAEAVAEGPGDVLDQRLELLPAPHVGGEGERPLPGLGLDLSRHPPPGLDPPRGDRHVGPRGGEPESDRPPEPPAPAGDQRTPPFEVESFRRRRRVRRSPVSTHVPILSRPTPGRGRRIGALSNRARLFRQPRAIVASR